MDGLKEHLIKLINSKDAKRIIYVFLAILLYVMNNPAVNPYISFVQLLETLVGAIFIS